MEFINITKKYGNNLVLSKVNLKLNNGLTLLLGKNGSGKSTLLKIALNLIKRYEGNFVNSSKITGIIESPNFIPYLTGNENLYYLLGENDMVQKYATYFQLEKELDEKVKTYSLGMRQKLALIYVFSSKSKVLVFDEPENSLDQITLNKLYKLLNKEKRNKIILVASHRVENLLKLSDEIYIINNKQIQKIDKNVYEKLKYKFTFKNEKQSNKAAKELKIKDYKLECNFIEVDIPSDDISNYIKKLSEYELLSVQEIKINLLDIFDKKQVK